MQPGALRALEFDRIVEAVSAFALTPMGHERLTRMLPEVGPQRVGDLLTHTTETVRFLAANGALPLRASADLSHTFSALAVEGRAIESLLLLDLAAFLESLEETRIAIRRAPGPFPRLEGISGAAASFKGETAAIREKIDPSGEVVDHASPALKIIRDKLRRQKARLRSTLESYLRGKETAKHLQDQIVTERNGRYVLVVKSEHRTAIPGIVHGASTSGASLFLEPLSTVEINNDIVALEEQEREEVRRILLALMAQAGLHIPAAEGSRLPVFESLFADIGDEQSIEANLSTFSGHVANIVAMDRALTTPALVLLDEVGSGTDPVEGGALGVAIVEHFRARGAIVIATSHYEQLKSYASTSAGVASAAFGFDADTFAPTYELIYGSPGRSLALEIAARLGLSPRVIQQARDNLSVREAQLSEHLAKIDRDMRSLEHEQRLATREREEVEAAALRLREREETLRRREETARQKLNEELEAQARQARREIDEVIADLKTKTAAIVQEAGRQPVSTGEAGAARTDARAAVDRVVAQLAQPAEAPRPAPAPARDPKVGDRVLVGVFGLEGTVTSLHDGSAEVDVRGKRMRAGIRELKVIEGAAPQPVTARVKVNVELQPRESTGSDLNVIGCTVDEALARAERFLDELLLTEQRTVRLIHGYGTGQLKRALSGFLEQHPLVARFAPAPPDQGGGGVTVVELKD
jgi:dsDNA-specific endonuclease/ATPase MutS2